MSTRDSDTARDRGSRKTVDREPPQPERDEQVSVAPPTVPPEYAHVDPDTVNRVLAEQRAQLARPSANVDIQGAPHFLRNVDGEEVCGSDGQSWPCAHARGSTGVAAPLEGADPADQLLPTMREAAQAAGMDLTEFAARLRQTRGQ